MTTHDLQSMIADRLNAIDARLNKWEERDREVQRLLGELAGKMHPPASCALDERIDGVEAVQNQQKGAFRTVLVALGIPTLLLSIYTLVKVIKG